MQTFARLNSHCTWKKKKKRCKATVCVQSVQWCTFYSKTTDTHLCCNLEPPSWRQRPVPVGWTHGVLGSCRRRTWVPQRLVWTRTPLEWRVLAPPPRPDGHTLSQRVPRTDAGPCWTTSPLSQEAVLKEREKPRHDSDLHLNPFRMWMLVRTL